MPLRGTKAFGKALRLASKAVSEEMAPILVGKLGLELLRGTVLASPVREGTLRGGWDLNLNRAVDRNRGADKAGQGTIQRGAQVASSVTKTTRRLVLSTPVVHAPVIERGRRADENGVMRGSVQAPQGMLGITVRRLRRSVPPAAVLRDVRFVAQRRGFKP